MNDEISKAIADEEACSAKFVTAMIAFSDAETCRRCEEDVLTSYKAFRAAEKEWKEACSRRRALFDRKLEEIRLRRRGAATDEGNSNE